MTIAGKLEREGSKLDLAVVDSRLESHMKLLLSFIDAQLAS